MWKRILLSLALVTVLLIPSCQYFNPLDPLIQIGIAWYNGEAQKYYNTDQQTLLFATKKALAELDLAITNEEVKKDTIYITAGDKARFHIKLKAVRPKTTRLSIRVNTFGDQQYAELIYRHVDAQPNVIQFTSLEQLHKAVD